MKKIKLLIIVNIILLLGLVDAASVNNNSQGKDQNFTLCEPPPCTVEQRDTLWPTPNKATFYQCAPDPWCGSKPVEMPCAPGTVFGYKEQVCIWECDWVDPCNGTATVVPPTSTTSVPTSSTTESSTSSTMKPPSSTTTESGTNSSSTDSPTSTTEDCGSDCTELPSSTTDASSTSSSSTEPSTSSTTESSSTTASSSSTTEESTTEASTSTTEEISTESSTTESSTSTTEESTTEASTSTTEEISTESSTTESSTSTTEESTTEASTSTTEDISTESSTTESSTSTTEEPTTESSTSTTEESTTESSTSTTEESTTEVSTSTTEQSTTESSNTQSSTTESSTATTEESTTESSTTEASTSTTEESTTESSTTESSTTESSSTESSTSTTEEATTESSTTESSTTEASTSTTEESTTESSTTESSTTQSSTTESSTTESSTSTTEESTTESSTTESSTSTTDSTTEPSTESSTSSTTVTETCPRPNCTIDERHKLWPVKDEPTDYYQCVPDRNVDCQWNVNQESCYDGQYFGFEEQECINPSDWKDVCSEDQPTTTASSSSTPTTQSTTEVTEDHDLCDEPACTDDETHRLWPSYEGADKYWQCIPKPGGVWDAELQTCPNGETFSFYNQNCNTEPFEDVCGGLEAVPKPDEPQEVGNEIEPTPCPIPDCSKEEVRARLQPSFDPRFFYVCTMSGNGTYKPVIMSCPPQQYFHSDRQVCVDPCDWEYSCGYYNVTTTTETVSEITDTETPPITVTTPETGETETPTEEPITDETTTEIGETTTDDSETEETEEPTTETEIPTTEPSSTTTEAHTGCDPPACKANETTLYPHEDPTKFYQCAPASGCAWAPVVMQCPKPLYFGFKQQVCVWCEDYENVCGEATTSTQVPTTTTTDDVSEVTDTETEPTSTTTQRSTTRSTTTSSTTIGVPPEGCQPPTCKANDTTLYPHEDPTKYYQCAPSSGCDWAPVVRQCPEPLFFGFKQQNCVWCDDYENVCNATTAETTAATTSAEPVTTTTRRTTTAAVVTKPAPPSTTSPPGSSTGFCVTPSCKTDLQKNTLWAHPDRNMYYQCAPQPNGTYQPVERPCSAGTVFHYKLQVCVWPSDWEDPCGNGNQPVARVRIASAPAPTKPKRGTSTRRSFINGSKLTE